MLALEPHRISSYFQLPPCVGEAGTVLIASSSGQKGERHPLDAGDHAVLYRSDTTMKYTLGFYRWKQTGAGSFLPHRLPLSGCWPPSARDCKIRLPQWQFLRSFMLGLTTVMFNAAIMGVPLPTGTTIMLVIPIISPCFQACCWPSMSAGGVVEHRGRFSRCRDRGRG